MTCANLWPDGLSRIIIKAKLVFARFQLWAHKYFFNTLRPRQNGHHFADNIFKCIFLNENVRISIKISLKFVPKDPINNTPALVQIMVWHRPGDKPLSEPMMVSLLMHICVTLPQWVKWGPWFHVKSCFGKFIVQHATAMLMSCQC